MPEITVEGLTKAFGGNRVLDDVTFKARHAEFVTLLGPSGCGKTTTLMSIAGFVRPDGGRIQCGDAALFDGHSRLWLAAERRNLGVVFQSYAVWPHMTVFDNVAFPLRIRRMSRQALRARVHEALDLVEISPQAGRYPHELSGGQQQRVAVARALVHEPSVLLLDEPFSSLDAKLRERARVWLKELQKSLSLTTLFVTHDQNEALAMSDRVLVMDRGRILQDGTPEEVYRQPRSVFVAEFVGQCNALPGTITGINPDATATVTLDGSDTQVTAPPPAEAVSGTRVTIVVRAEAIRIVDDTAPGRLNTYRADVKDGLFQGSHYLYDVTVGGQAIMVATGRRLTAASVVVEIPPESCRLLTA